ncbi:2-octaprenyl-6-methoxyphenol hydroxylase /2-octaprenyl-3-methyl-6-methoxy-1,4-benzoquinol hydroxylase [Pseudidiomarina planktonica]|uniref:2-octaprenyl-6-methoxyphenol hydroxylase /2-octaprenyl-3-methyl-6-methoxy-1,4-benzoquinol hydroxylase n=1 Tax=Pseudidiomarina planktonica TaxID=1323738 RepID=A0A1Y6FZH0_9GAMM|nr:2-octaprenyl-6-methoxyphenyl hydroxylase [Pseudidiomarina planktonica]RUO63304.1 2-octaprenyl-6-methoxyphenyl hydroxylase [Pseudidiomarina planktonica]SMQ80476.1 2-octaprenyl-6-methoxyphenol hydroxylase /2-octaprenyl-3-methyl-6-methoxy-1,4-benzoquinol hydroxylase [Pseudidiomarina planktonica]
MAATAVASAPTAHIGIAGGGLVGALAAVLLARSRPDWQILVIEPQAAGPARDKRTIALAAGTVEILAREQLWPALAEHACAIEHIHVSDRGHAGMVRLHAADEGVAALGQVVAAAQLNQVLFDACQQQPNIQWLGGQAVTGVTQQQDTVVLELSDADPVQVQLLIGADGQKSQVRQQLGIAMQATDYQQVGIIGRLQLAQSLKGWAYERFTDSGPMALLPVQPGPQETAVASLVWSVTPDRADALLTCPEAEFIEQCQTEFGFRAGRFTGVSERVAFPLQLQLAERSVSHRCVLVGNASHALHPIAGQGFNLGVRDVLALVTALKQVDDAGAYQSLRHYWQRREQDYQVTIGLTEWLVHGFSNNYSALTGPRNMALLALDKVGPLRHAFARKAMGK